MCRRGRRALGERPLKRSLRDGGAERGSSAGRAGPGRLAALAERAARHLRSCALCPRRCGVDRQAGERGFCGTGHAATVAAFSLHFGEEPPISGTGGSGNVFFSGCNLACIFCQNYPISRLGVGREVSTGELAEAFLRFERQGAHNVNLVSPTPWTPQILRALARARKAGLSLPVVYNTGGYDSLESLGLLEGAVDIYLPDMKYPDDGSSWRLSRTPRYVKANRRALAEMLRQVGPLALDRDGIAWRGVLVRHLVLPEGAAGTKGVVGHLRSSFPRLPVSMMYQYFPAYKAVGHPLLGRPLWRDECADADALLVTGGIEEGWVQDYT